MSATIYFIRHGQTDWNAEGRFQGQQDIPLNANGRAQAQRNGRILGSVIDRPDDLDYVASPLGRACETMEIVREGLGLPRSGYRTDARLKELTFGIWEGRTLVELAANEPVAHAAREADRWGFAPPDGESYARLAERIAPVLADIRRDTVLVSHGGVMRCLRGLACGTPFADVPHLETPQDRIMILHGADVSWI